MPVYSGDSRLKDVIIHDFTVIPLINRFGIFLGVGDETIGEICVGHGIDTGFFLSILNTYLKDDYTPQIEWEKWDLKETVDFLRKTNQYYTQTLLPTIECHFRMLYERSRHQKNNISYLWSFFKELKDELEARIEIDEKIWFPALMNQSKREECRCSLNGIPTDESVIEDKVNDLVSFFVMHLKGDYDHNLCMGVVTSVSTLDKEIMKYNRIRQKILRPLTFSLIDNEKTR